MTLQQLKEKLEEEAKQHMNDDPINIAEHLDNILEQYELSEEEYDYVLGNLISLEEQTNKATLINAKKAAQILLNRKKK